MRTTGSARPASSTCPRRRSAGSRCSPTTAATTGQPDRDPSPDPVPGAERRARVRRRDGPVVMGPRQHQRRARAPTDPSGNPPDPNMQQATVNLFADMGAQPATLMPACVAADAVDGHDPADVDDHAPGDRRERSHDGSATTVTGTATDAGGGVVAGVEVSTDGGATWHPATLTPPAARPSAGRTAGSPTAIRRRRSSRGPSTTAATSRRRRSGVTVNVSCPCSIWGTGATPTTVDAGDADRSSSA